MKRFTVCVAAAVLVAACSGSTGPGAVGVLVVSAATTGTDLDANGYLVQVDAGAGQALPTNGAITIAGVRAGNHTVLLGGVAANCLVDGTNPRPLTVAGGDTVQLAFDVGCAAPIGGSGDIVGVWDWTEHFDDPANSATCDDTGSYVFAVTAAGFAGRSDQVGVCAAPSGLFPNATSDTVLAGSVNAGSMDFVVGPNADCQYSAVFAGTTDHLAGTATCGTATGTWAADRALPLASLALASTNTTIPPDAVFPLVLVLRNTLGNRVFDRAVTWSSDAPTVVAVDTVGLVRALQTGTALIQAGAEGLSAQTTVTVGGTIVPDAVGDTFGDPATPQVDILSLSAASDSSDMTVLVRVSNPGGGQILGLLDLDVDQNPATGAQAQVDFYRPDTTGASGLGDEFVCDLATGDLYDAVTTFYVTTVSVYYDPATGALTARLPVAILGSLHANMAVLVADSLGHPTDIAPNDGHLTLGGSAASAAAAPAAPRPALRLPWGSRAARSQRGKIP